MGQGGIERLNIETNAAHDDKSIFHNKDLYFLPSIRTFDQPCVRIMSKTSYLSKRWCRATGLTAVVVFILLLATYEKASIDLYHSYHREPASNSYSAKDDAKSSSPAVSLDLMSSPQHYSASNSTLGVLQNPFHGSNRLLTS